MHRGPEQQQENRQRGGGERKKTSYIHMGRSQGLPLPTMPLASWLQPFPAGIQPGQDGQDSPEKTYSLRPSALI